MPPTVPAGLPCVAVVFARLIVNGEDCGHRPFIVPLNDGKQMCTGIQSRYVTTIRAHSNPFQRHFLIHCIHADFYRIAGARTRSPTP